MEAKFPPVPPRRIDRSDWEERALKRNPEILQLKQSIQPFERFQNFVQLYTPGKESVKQHLTDEHIIKLIIQHLTFYGFNSAAQVLSKESKVECNVFLVLSFQTTNKLIQNSSVEDENLLSESRLLYFLRKAVKEVDSIYNLAIADHELPEGYSEGDLEELLYNLELIDIESIVFSSV